MSETSTATDSATQSTPEAYSVRVEAVRHLSDDVARAAEQGDLALARVLAKTLSELLGLGNATTDDVIDIAKARAKRSK